ncbi:MAG: polyribonucleotide nucleotidyltransferase, partial [Patescibacteria group bacterium]
MKKKIFSTQVGGRELIAEFNDMAMQADGSCMVRYGDTVVLATAVMNKEGKSVGDFFPLTVDYEEKYYAAGEILGSRFVRREGRPSEEAVLVSRLIDRTIRPLFDKKIRNAVHVVVMALSVDGVNDPDIPAIIAASLALGVSDIPWAGPVSAVRIGGGNGAFFINPTHEERVEAAIDMVICGKDGKINMVEAGCVELPEERAVDALNEALKHVDSLQEFQQKIIAEIGQPKRKIEFLEEPKGLRELFKSHFRARLDDIIYIFDKATRNYRIGELKNEMFAAVEERFGKDYFNLASEIFEEEINDLVHENILSKEKRPDSRKIDEVRELQAHVALLPRAHGSGLFY